MQTLLGRHGPGEHVEADGAGQLRLERLRRHGDLRLVRDGLLRRPVQLVQRQVPRPLRRVQRRHPRRRGDLEEVVSEGRFLFLFILVSNLLWLFLVCGR